MSTGRSFGARDCLGDIDIAALRAVVSSSRERAAELELTHDG